MVEAFMTPSWVDRGVPQGSPLSRTLYNIFMDEFAERVAAMPMDVSDVPAVRFPEDVMLAAITTGAAVAFGHSSTVGG